MPLRVKGQLANDVRIISFLRLIAVQLSYCSAVSPIFIVRFNSYEIELQTATRVQPRRVTTLSTEIVNAPQTVVAVVVVLS